VAAAPPQDVHAILYMNQRLWGTQTQSWTAEGAEAHAVKGPDGKVHREVYNAFLKAPCAPMCMGTRFWRDKYAGLAQDVRCRLKADGIYMDQTGVLANCCDPRHGHRLGAGRYWTDALALLTGEIRERCATRGPVALGGEYCGEPFGAGGLTATPDNPRGSRSMSRELRCKGQGEWNVYDVVCVDGTVKLAINGKFVNSIRDASVRKGYLCVESEDSEIHFRNIRILELPPGLTTPEQTAQVVE
jgi:hypothetical protein